MELFSSLNVEAIENILNLNTLAKNELSKNIRSYNFNIFNIKEATKNNELKTTVCYIFALEKIFDQLPIKNETFLKFMNKVQ